MKKLITLILAIVMTASIFAACGGNTPADTTGKPSEGTPGDTNESTPDDSPIIDCPGPQPGFNLDDLDYGNKEVHVFHWGNADLEFTPDENANDKDPISKAIYTRNLKIEEGLGIRLDFIDADNVGSSNVSFASKLKNQVQNPETPVDIIASYSTMTPYVLIEGLYTDLNAYSDIDLTRTWWPGNVREAHEIKGKLYFITGEASVSMVTELEALFMNVDMFKSLGNDYDKFIKDVKQGKWTLDDLITLTKGVYKQLDNISGESKGDSFAIIGDSEDFSRGMWTSMCYTLFDISKDDKAIFELSEDVLGDNAAEFVKKMTELNNSVDAYFQPVGTADTMITEDKLTSFVAGRTVFMPMSLGDLDADAVKDADYIALPYPKGSKSQENYHTAVGNQYSLFGICSSATDKVLAARTLETWSYYGSLNTTYAVYEAI